MVDVLKAEKLSWMTQYFFFHKCCKSSVQRSFTKQGKMWAEGPLEAVTDSSLGRNAEVRMKRGATQEQAEKSLWKSRH